MPNLIILLLLMICSFGAVGAGLLKRTQPTFCERVADAFERLIERFKDRIVILIERFKDQVTANLESDLAYTSSILTAIVALSLGHSYTASVGAGMAIAAAWSFRQNHRWPFMPYAVVSLLVWTVGVFSASGHSGFCIVAIIVLWLVCSAYNYVHTPATNKLSPWLTGFLGPLHWVLVLPAALGVIQSVKLTRQSYLLLTDWRRRGLRSLGK